MISMMEWFLIFVIFVTSLGLIVSLSNLYAVKRLGEYTRPRRTPLVSILVPARNEARNIEACVTSLLQQDYPNFEVIALDDNSKDDTPAILRRLARQDPRLKVISGQPLPDGWPGKHWACQQLSDHAHGEYLLFTDADTRHNAHALSAAMAAMESEDLDLATALPREEVLTWSEKLMVPFMNFAIQSFLPIRLVQELRIPDLSVTIGQFMLFRRSAYDGIGGYNAARVNVNDDVILGRMIIKKGYQWRLFNGSDEVTCRMYHNFQETLEGFSKNVFGFFGYKVIPHTMIWSIAGLMFTLPAWIVFRYFMGDVVSPTLVNFAAVAALESLALFLVAYHRQRVPLYLAFIFPFTVFAFSVAALRSMVLTITGHASWKGRELMKADVRWL